MKKGKNFLITAFVVFSILLTTFLAYKDILSYFFTGMDTVPLIHSARIQSLSDIKRILLEPGLKDFPDAIGTHKWYRPVSVLSYSIDYAVWGLNPFGYHLTDLLLHCLVLVSIFFLIRLMTTNLPISVISAFIFTLHPLLTELVPVNARRMDTLATLFTVLSLLFFMKYFSAKMHKQKSLFFSIILYALAIGSKEIAVIVPILIFAYSFIYSFKGQPVKAKMTQAIHNSIPYIMVTAGYIAVRLYVLGGIGGYTTRPKGLSSIFQQLIYISCNYFISLVYPVDFLQLTSLFHASAVTLFPFFILLFFVVLILVAYSFIGIYRYDKIKKYFMETGEGKIVGFMLIWLFLPLIVYLLTLIYGRYYLYIAIIPFSIILSVIFCMSLQPIIKRKVGSLLVTSVTRLFAIACLLISLLAYSSILRKYDGWEDSSKISQAFFNKIQEYLPHMPNDAVLHIYNFPAGILNTPYAKEVEFPANYSIKPWLDLSYPSNRIKIIVHNKALIDDKRDSIDIQISSSIDKNVLITVNYDKDE